MRGRIGLLGHDPLLYRDLTGRENLRYHARLHGVGERADRARCSTRSAWPGVPTSRSGRSRAGMVQRLAVCRAVLHDPELLLLDEPRANLDPAAGELVEPLIGRASGRTRVITSHDPAGGLAEADVVLGLRGGRPALVGRAGELDAAARGGALPMSGRADRGRRSAPSCARSCGSSCGRSSRSRRCRCSRVTTFVLFHFAPRRDTVDGDLASGILWVTLLFASILAINRLFVADAEQGGFDGFLLAPVDRSALLIAKVLTLLAFLVVLEIVAVPAFGLLLLGPSLGPVLPGWSASSLLADVGIAAVGTLVSALAVRSRTRDLLGPLLPCRCSSRS